MLLMIIISDVFFYFHLKRKESKPIFIILHVLAAVFFVVLFFYIKFGLNSSQNFRVVAEIMWLYFFFLMIYISKLLHIIFYFAAFLYKKFLGRENIYFNIIRIALTVFVVVTMLISAYITPRNFEVTHVKVPIKDLPASFEGYKIVQISDIHLGSWNKKYKKIKQVVKLVNEQKADIVVFTGDMVNNFSGEAETWTPYFREMQAQDGKYAVLGNHDYGDYIEWKSEFERKENFDKIKQHIRDFGFRLLLNESVYLKKDTDSILLVGVENWGKAEKYRYSDLRKALRAENSNVPKILLSHDPTHWEAEVLGKQDIALTLAGHTHAAQLGLKIGDRLFSPASLAFKYWYGLYSANNQYLYVNRGVGYIGLPMHIGVRPEITVIELVSQYSGNDK
jgi:hypothetical protein